MGLWNLIVRFFQGGGDFMYPIAVVFVFGVAIAIARTIARFNARLLLSEARRRDRSARAWASEPAAPRDGQDADSCRTWRG